jgi:hypothetical protein
MKSIQYTIRNIPSHVDTVLRQQAKKRGDSFNETVVQALEKATGVTNKPVMYNDLDWFIGQKQLDNRAFDSSMEWLDKLPADM